jgi:hypothetical protein
MKGRWSPIGWIQQPHRESEPAWRELALKNQVEHLQAEIASGLPLGSFIQGREVQYMFEVTLGKVRDGLGPIVFPFRCDAPDRRRFMEQTIQLVEVSCRLLKEETHEPIALLAEDEQSDLLLWLAQEI